MINFIVLKEYPSIGFFMQVFGGDLCIFFLQV